MGENIFMLPDDMNVKIRSGTDRYNNKIYVSNGKFGLGKNDKVNDLEAQSALQAEVPVMKIYKVLAQTAGLGQTSATHKNQEPQTITHIGHNEEKIALVLFLAVGFAIWNMFYVS